MNWHKTFAVCVRDPASILRGDRVGRPVATVLQLPVEMVQQVTHEFMGVLLLIASVLNMQGFCSVNVTIVAVERKQSLSLHVEVTNLKLGMIFQMV